MGIFAMGNLRNPIAMAAPFWTRGPILVIGFVYGMFLAVTIFLLSGLATTSHAVRIGLMLLGLLSAGYVGFQPRPEDIHRKSEQTGTVASASYILVAIGMTIYSYMH